ncbi:hypothetical protein SPOG_03603 [Schizosaccharomyces cryophilus OY26]|uniref:Uncharacterized protein n=1 Tax=Schizosaccharomyces cryophilus (strain OY26 / ATCC MYA-4695 / CBS 11777 / NBRC 106824 / NRRL Y48691) TaxID=653667 RepID=S9W3B5_SCHCR|nr:uncharacterized protein SPOG_03603 [Schizosaccharomyces cryophilus OY26]EPY53049.1 hypothetical protein SPOG_03603 [Schizosaccharomyces cryophilus OY26]
MKNKYTPVSDSDDSSKTLNDEKAESRPLSDGTPPPYSASKKYIDLEIALETEEISKKKRYLTPRELAVVFTVFIVYNVCLFIARAVLLVYEIHINQIATWVLLFVWCVLFLSLAIVITQMPKEWFTQAGRSTKKVFSAMCVAALYVCSLDVPGFAMYYNIKKLIGFEKINNPLFYAVCFVNFALFLYLTMNPNARELLGSIIIDLKNDFGHGLGNAVDRLLGANRTLASY